MIKKFVILGALLFLIACNNKEILTCEKDLALDAFPSAEGKLITTVTFTDEQVTEYVNKYVLQLDEDEVKDVYQSVKNYYTKTENKIMGAEQEFAYGSDYVVYKVIYDMANYDDSILEFFGNKDDVRFNLEQKDNYRCR